MKIIGIHDGHNASACLLEDGQIVAAIQEERLRRGKNWAGIPVRAIEFVLQKGGRSIGDIDGCGGLPPHCNGRSLRRRAEYVVQSAWPASSGIAEGCARRFQPRA